VALRAVPYVIAAGALQVMTGAAGLGASVAAVMVIWADALRFCGVAAAEEGDVLST
jgi:hypothetical protein